MRVIWLRYNSKCEHNSNLTIKYTRSSKRLCNDKCNQTCRCLCNMKTIKNNSIKLSFNYQLQPFVMSFYLCLWRPTWCPRNEIFLNGTNWNLKFVIDWGQKMKKSFFNWILLYVIKIVIIFSNVVVKLILIYNFSLICDCNVFPLFWHITLNLKNIKIILTLNSHSFY